MTKLLDKHNHKEDLLIKMMKIQVDNNDRHTINYGMTKKTNLENVLTKLNEDQSRNNIND